MFAEWNDYQYEINSYAIYYPLGLTESFHIVKVDTFTLAGKHFGNKRAFIALIIML